MKTFKVKFQDKNYLVKAENSNEAARKVIDSKKVNAGNSYSKKFRKGDKVRFVHSGGRLSKEVATITGYDRDGNYTYTWDDGEKGEGSSDSNFRKA